MRIKMPAVRIAQADADSGAEGAATPVGGASGDTLTCGSCRRAFALADIVRFIQHKVASCDKDASTFGHCYNPGPPSDRDNDTDGGRALSASSRRPSMLRRAGSSRIHTPPPASPAHTPHHLLQDGGASSTPKRLLDDVDGDPETITPKRRASSCSSPEADVKPIVKQEDTDALSSPDDVRKAREVADAESNTMHSEPSNYVCSTCKARMHSAWRLLQHAQHVHGARIYVEGGSATASPPDRSATSSTASSSGCSSTGPSAPLQTHQQPQSHPQPSLRHHPLLPPPDVHNPFGLLRMPLAPLGHPQLPQPPLFGRHGHQPQVPAHHQDPHRFRVEQLVSEQFRHHGLNLAAAAAAVANSLPHRPFPSPAERPSIVPASAAPASRERGAPPVNTRPLNLEPQLDFYSQRLRQLAGTTSPGAATGEAGSPSPRKLSPTYASPSPSRLAQTPGSNHNDERSENENNSAVVTGSRPRTATPPEQRSELSAAPAHAPAITFTPRSACTPPDKQALEPTGASDDADAAAVHACELCGKKFRFRNNLEVHMLAHAGEKLYKCTACEFTCSHINKLKRHMRVHRSPDDACSNSESIEAEDDSDEELEEEESEAEEEEENEEEIEEAEDLSVPSVGPTGPAPRKHQPVAPSAPTIGAASLVGELMDKFGLSNIAQYSEAYKQALQESGNALKWQLASKDRDNNNGLCAVPPSSRDKLEQPPVGLRLKEEFKNASGPPHPLFNPFENPFEASKRMKLEMERGDSWWLPALHGQRPQDGLFDSLKAGPNGLLQNPLLKNKESRRNDTCEYCGKVFKNCSNLTVHRRSHTGEKPYKCELCSYACAQSSKLTRHMKTHGRLGKDVYRCRFCEMPFSVPSTLEKHMRKCVVNQSNGGAISDDSVPCREEAA